MNLFKFSLKLTAQILFVIIFFSTLQAKNLDKFNDGNNISNYLSAILLFQDNKYKDSYNFLKKLNGLEESHINYSARYILSLINTGKFNEAFTYAKKLEKKNLDNFESNLIIGIYYLKKGQFQLAQEYFLKIKNINSKFLLHDFVSNSLLNWASIDRSDFIKAQSQINLINPKFENLKNIQNVFLHCYYKSEKTNYFFKKLTSNTKVDYSRYNYFHASYLVDSGKINEAKQVIDTSLELHPRNLLLNQYKIDLNGVKNINNFNCQNQSHVAAEILYIVANALSTQSIYTSSNFYLNIAKYLNNNFHSFDNLLAENFYKINNLTQAKNIYKNLANQGAAYNWYAAKRNFVILIKQDEQREALKFLTNNYNKLPKKNIYETYDYASFLKNNDQFNNSIKFYSEVIQKIEKSHSLYPKALDGRGVAYERLGEWKKAEKDLLASLDASPNQAYVINYLAYSWIELGVNIEQSLKMLKKANNIKLNDPYITDSLGWALFKLKKYEEAKKYLELAVELMPTDPVVNDHYGDALWKNGKQIQARYYWNYVLSLNNTKEDLKNNIKDKLISGL